MKNGLKEKLNDLIKEQGTVSLDQVYAFAKGLNHKQKTAERELNPSRSPNIKTLKNEKHQIIGYQYVDPLSYTKPEPISEKEWWKKPEYQRKEEVKPISNQLSLI